MQALSLIACPSCLREGSIEWKDANGVCVCGRAMPIEHGIIRYTATKTLEENAEARARDSEAAGYLAHSKFPTQISRVKQFLATVPETVKSTPVLELGSGPGPYTKLLLES